MKSSLLLTLVLFCGCSMFPFVNWTELEKKIQSEIESVLASKDIEVPANVEPDVSTSKKLVQDPVFKGSKMHTASQEVASWTPVSKLTVARYGGSCMRLDVDDATRDLWPDDCTINVLCTLQDDEGNWHTAPCDWVKRLPSVKDLSCLCVCDGDTRIMEPRQSRLVGITISSKCRHVLGKEKLLSTTVWMTVNW